MAPIHPKAVQLHHAKFGEMALLIDHANIIVAEQDALIAQLRARVAELEQKYEPKPETAEEGASP